jgi:MFS family permease
MEPAESYAPIGVNRGVMATLALSILLASLGTSIANIALPNLAHVFAAPFHHVQWVVVAYLAAMTVSVVFAGRLGDARGLRHMFLVGLGVFAIASLFCSLAPSLWFLIGARALQGVGAAFLTVLSMALMRETAQAARVGRAMGLLGTMSALGTVLGPSLGGVLVSAFGWRGVFAIQVPLALLALVLAFIFLSRGQAKKVSQPAHVWAELSFDILPGLLVNILVAAVMMTTLVVGPFYLGRGLGLAESVVGLVMSVGPAISIIGGVLSGRSVDRWGAQRILFSGLVLLATGAFLLSAFPNMFGLAGYILAVFVLTPGYQLFQAANNTAVLADTSPNRRGTVAGLLTLSRNIGLILGASAMGAVFAFGVGTGDFSSASTGAIAHGMQLTFLLAGSMLLFAILIVLSQRFSTKRKDRPS